MLVESYVLSFGPDAVRRLEAGRVSVLGAAFFHATCLRSPTSLREAITSLVARGMTEEEVRAGCAEALLVGIVRTDGMDDFRPGDARFFWPVRRASD